MYKIFPLILSVYIYRLFNQNYDIKVKLTFHTMLHIISTNNYLKSYNQICTTQSTFFFENKLLNILVQTNKGVYMYATNRNLSQI
jgi:hypothetical protein